MEFKQPTTKRVRSRTRRLLSAKTVIIGLVIIGCLSAGLLIRHFLTKDTVAQEPDYTTVLPEGKNAGELGGWKRISPPENDPVFAYADRVDGIPISVSQQPLPQDFKSNPSGKVAELAQKFNATDKLDADDITVYVGASSKGPQSVIFTKNDVLILIKSESKVSDAAWVSYVKSLD